MVRTLLDGILPRRISWLSSPVKRVLLQPARNLAYHWTRGLW
ncbi:MAG TPA: hypothetical protein VMV59_04955 [Candidatus Dormibacteraeota bacterium]|nr:hypothetical protein [Candidatus Dormibacteraeota bacterium]